MNQVNRTGEDRRQQSKKDVLALEASRSETLSLYADLASHRPFSVNKQLQSEIKRFCEALIDYTASAHFQLYQHLEENKERRMSVYSVAEKVYDQIANTTDHILAFNDRYGDDVKSIDDTKKVEEDLSFLGEMLANRIQYEDQIIEALKMSGRRKDQAR